MTPGQCLTCRLRERLRDLLVGPDGTISLALQGLYDNLAGCERPSTVLDATGTLPLRDEQLARLEAWITQTVDGHPDPGQRQLLHRYAVWHVVRGLGQPPRRHRQLRPPSTQEQAHHAGLHGQQVGRPVRRDRH